MILGIYGAGGLGREILAMAKQINRIKQCWENIVFIDDSRSVSSLKGIDVLSFDDIKSQYIKSNFECIIAVGEPSIRRMLRERVTGQGIQLTTLIHPSVNILDHTVIGSGSIISYNCFISCDVVIGENVLCQPSVSIGHDNIIGNDTVLSTYVCLAGGCKIGHETYIGLEVPVKEGITVGNNSIVGMGSVVIRDIPDQVIAVGNPARAMKNNVNNRVFHNN